MNERDESPARLRALVEEQAARRVATLVASDPEPQQVFERVCEEVATVLGIEGTNLTRFEDDGTQTVLAGWSAQGHRCSPSAVASRSRVTRPSRRCAEAAGRSVSTTTTRSEGSWRR